MKKQKGFSLVEVMVAAGFIVVLGIVGLLFFPDNNTQNPVDFNEPPSASIEIPAPSLDDVEEMIVNDENEKILEEIIDIIDEVAETQIDPPSLQLDAGQLNDMELPATVPVAPGIPTPVPSPTSEPQVQYKCLWDSYNCKHFGSQAAAQAVYIYCGGVNNDIHSLDRDKNGLACETLP